MFRRKKALAILGCRGVGKTTYLCMLIKQLSDCGQISPPRLLEGRDYFFAVQRSLYVGEAGGIGPPPTKPASVYYFRIRVEFEFNGRKYEITTLDLPGFEVERLGEVTRRLLSASDGILFLIEPSPDPELRVRQTQTVYKMLEWLTQFWRKRVKKPLAFVFTKNDIYQIKNPARAFYEYTREVYNVLGLISRYVERYEFFACSALGAPLDELRARGELPRPIAVELPFLWVLRHL